MLFYYVNNKPIPFINEPGLCYGKLEAGVLTFVVPAVLLGHLVTPRTQLILPFLEQLLK